MLQSKKARTRNSKEEIVKNFTEVDLSWALKVEDFLRTVLHGSQSKRQLRTKKQPKLTQKGWRWSKKGPNK